MTDEEIALGPDGDLPLEDQIEWYRKALHQTRDRLMTQERAIEPPDGTEWSE